MISFIKRIDNLGRIVIPKEIRRILKIENNENMEIMINNEEIIIKKHNLLNNIDKITKIGSIINKMVDNNIIIANRDKVIYSNIREIINKEVSNRFKDIIINRLEINNNMELNITNDYSISTNYAYKNIIIDSDSSGIIIEFGKDISERDILVVEIASKLLNY